MQRVQELVNSAFTKGLVATILAWFPGACIASIILGFMGNGTLNRAYAAAKEEGCAVSGKRIPAKILSLVGGIGGIAMTVFYFIMLIVFIGVTR